MRDTSYKYVPFRYHEHRTVTRTICSYCVIFQKARNNSYSALHERMAMHDVVTRQDCFSFPLNDMEIDQRKEVLNTDSR